MISVKNIARLYISRYMGELQRNENDSSKSYTDVTIITSRLYHFYVTPTQHFVFIVKHAV